MENGSGKQLYKAVYSMEISLNRLGEKKFGTLARKREEQSDTSTYYNEIELFDKLSTFIQDEINNNLMQSCRASSNTPIEFIEVTEIAEGSIIVFFTVAYTVLQVISGLKDLYDSIEIVAKIANAFISRRLKEVHGSYFVVNTEVIRAQEGLYCYSKSVVQSKNRVMKMDWLSELKTSSYFILYLILSNAVLMLLLVLSAIWFISKFQ